MVCFFYSTNNSLTVFFLDTIIYCQCTNAHQKAQTTVYTVVWALLLPTTTYHLHRHQHKERGALAGAGDDRGRGRGPRHRGGSGPGIFFFFLSLLLLNHFIIRY